MSVVVDPSLARGRAEVVSAPPAQSPLDAFVFVRTRAHDLGAMGRAMHGRVSDLFGRGVESHVRVTVWTTTPGEGDSVSVVLTDAGWGKQNAMVVEADEAPPVPLEVRETLCAEQLLADYRAALLECVAIDKAAPPKNHDVVFPSGRCEHWSGA